MEHGALGPDERRQVLWPVVGHPLQEGPDGREEGVHVEEGVEHHRICHQAGRRERAERGLRGGPCWTRSRALDAARPWCPALSRVIHGRPRAHGRGLGKWVLFSFIMNAGHNIIQISQAIWLQSNQMPLNDPFALSSILFNAAIFDWLNDIKGDGVGCTELSY